MEDQERFGSKLVSDQILGFYRVNLVQQFSFNRTFHHGVRDPDNLFSSLWMERTILTTSHVLPGILRWFPVVNSRVIQISPLQNAIETMESTNRILKKNILAHCYDPHLCLHPLTIKLKGVLDAAVNGGISNYEKAFFTDKYALFLINYRIPFQTKSIVFMIYFISFDWFIDPVIQISILTELKFDRLSIIKFQRKYH